MAKAKIEDRALARSLAEIGDDVQSLGVDFEQLAGLGEILNRLAQDIGEEHDRALMGLAAAVVKIALAGQDRALHLGSEVRSGDLHASSASTQRRAA